MLAVLPNRFVESSKGRTSRSRVATDMIRIGIFVFVYLLIFSAVFCPCESWAQKESLLDLSKTELKALIDVAERKARELGYKPESLEREIAKSGNLFRVSYYPRQRYEEGTIYGGAINIYLNKSGQIRSY
jgi:hypothetical protein